MVLGDWTSSPSAAHHCDSDRGADAAHQGDKARRLVELGVGDVAEGNGVQGHEEQAHACARYHAWPNEAPGIDVEREMRHHDGANR
jgi:hypothetical protein